MLICWLKWSRYLPLPLLHGLGNIAGWLLWLLPNDQRRVAQINLRHCLPEISASDRERLTRRSLCESAKALLELGPVWLRPGNSMLKWVRRVDGEADWQAASATGAIILTPHLGAWEVAGLYVSTHYPLISVFRPSRQGSELDALIKTSRERAGGVLVPANKAGVRALYKGLRAGRNIGILPDQDPATESGIFAPFFQQPAFTMTLVARLASANGLVIYLAVAERLSWGRGYHIKFEQVAGVDRGIDLSASVSRINAAVEKAIRRAPEQYLWSYKRFKTTPGERPSIYAKGKR